MINKDFKLRAVKYTLEKASFYKSIIFKKHHFTKASFYKSIIFKKHHFTKASFYKSIIFTKASLYKSFIYVKPSFYESIFFTKIINNMKILIYIFLLFQVFCVESIPISMTSELLRQIRAENISFSDAEIIWESYDTSTILLFLLLQVQHTENITYSDTESTGGIEKKHNRAGGWVRV